MIQYSDRQLQISVIKDYEMGAQIFNFAPES